jgi:hypothetical protein
MEQDWDIQTLLECRRMALAFIKSKFGFSQPVSKRIEESWSLFSKPQVHQLIWLDDMEANDALSKAAEYFSKKEELEKRAAQANLVLLWGGLSISLTDNGDPVLEFILSQSNLSATFRGSGLELDLSLSGISCSDLKTSIPEFVSVISCISSLPQTSNLPLLHLQLVYDHGETPEINLALELQPVFLTISPSFIESVLTFTRRVCHDLLLQEIFQRAPVEADSDKPLDL